MSAHALTQLLPCAHSRRQRLRECGKSRATTASTGHATAQEQPAVLARRHALLASGAALLLLHHTPPTALAAVVPFPKKVLVVGATGETGRRIVAQLRAAGVAVRAGVRDVKKGQSLGLALAGAELVKADVTDGVDALVDAIGDADAVVCATGFTPSFNLGKDNAKAVDGLGTRALIDAAKRAGVKRLVLVTSLLTNAPAVGQAENPNYKVLNLFGGILDEKRGSEIYLERSGLQYTIIRPGGLSNDPPSVTGAIIAGPADTFLGLESDPGREISRDSVALVCVEALRNDSSVGKIMEIVASPTAATSTPDAWFAV